MKKALLGIDVGTTGAKASIFDLSGNLLGYGFKEYGVKCERQGWAEQDAEEVWKATKQVIKTACKNVGESVTAISISVQGDAVIPIDESKNAIGTAHLGMDYRGLSQTEKCKKMADEREIYNLTGMRPHPMNSIIKIAWIKENQPSLYQKAYKFVTYADFIMAKLGSDEIVIDYTMASRTMAFDTISKKWANEILRLFGISEDKLAKPTPSGTVVGTINEDLANELGISKSAVLVTGGHDQTCAALGAGVIDSGVALDSHGTAEVLSFCLPKISIDERLFSGYYPYYSHVVKDKYFTFALNHTGGILLKWYAEQFCNFDYLTAKEKGVSVYDVIMENLPKEISPVMVLPHLNGSGNPVCDLSSKGVIVGLTMNTNRYDIAKAVLESLAFEMRLNIEYLKSSGIEINRINCVGGGARSDIGVQLKADVLSMPVHTLKIRESACLGASLLAGVAVGEYKSFEQAIKVVETEKTYYPREEFSKKYDERYKIYKQLYSIVKEINYKL